LQGEFSVFVNRTATPDFSALGFATIQLERPALICLGPG
jgi:hypothetical protein